MGLNRDVFGGLFGRQCKALTLSTLFLTLVILLSAGCTGKKKPLFVGKCDADNLNCADSILNLSTAGAKQDLSVISVLAGDTFDGVSVKPIRYQEKTAVTFQIENIRLVPLHGFQVTLSPGGSEYTIEADVDDSCADTLVLLYGQSCNVVISYTPGTVPPDQEILFQFTTLLGGTLEFNSQITGAEIMSDFYVDADELTFSDELVHDASSAAYVEQDVTIINRGSVVDIANIHFTISDPLSEYSIVAAGAGYCTDGQTLAANGDSCIIKVRYKPQVVGQVKSAQLTLSGSGAMLRQYTIVGSAKGLQADFEEVSFPAQIISGSAVQQVLQITNLENNGLIAASNCTYVLTGDATFTVASNTCAATLAAGASCAVTLSYTPTVSAARHTGELAVACDDRGGSLTMIVTGQTVSSPILTDAAEYDLGETLIGSVSTKTVTFTNEGSLGALTSFLPELEDLSGAGFTLGAGSCANNLTGGGTCTVTLRFAPTESTPASSVLNAEAAETSMLYGVLVKASGLSVQASQSLVDFGALLAGTDRIGADVIVTNPSRTQTATGCAFTLQLILKHALESPRRFRGLEHLRSAMLTLVIAKPKP